MRTGPNEAVITLSVHHTLPTISLLAAEIRAGSSSIACRLLSRYPLTLICHLTFEYLLYQYTMCRGDGLPLT
ncbi:hypothetical protein BofuT4_P145870.1 [Botrytis cinerea T4]|uniref:Uncharacterized protein n=1 Tax=Botryotinia fuckeliana (strain T4) TaxID=999810 RepID=G2YXS0_BOTF4|nr:hypothetical protein BofuT4_P145870.1 [Botrytis cinerea T4]